MPDAQGAIIRFVGGLEPWIRVYSYGLVGFFLLGLTVLAAGSIVARRRLAAAERGLRALPALSVAEAATGATEQTYADLVSLIDALPDGGGSWWAAVRPTVEQYARPDATHAAQVGYFVTERVEESVLDASGSGEGWLGFVHAVPGVLTALGLLGTFIALLIGLHGLVPHEDGTYALAGLISNLSGKFVTSIVALTMSVVFVLLELAARSSLIRVRLRLVHTLSRVLPFLSPSHLLLDIQRDGTRQSSVLGALQQIGEQQSAVLKALHSVGERQMTQLERFNTDVAVSIGSAMDARIVPVLERLLHSTNELHRIQAGLGEELLREVGDKISGAVSGAAGEEMRSMTGAIKESVRSLNEAAQAMRDGQGKLVEVTSAIIEQMNHALGENSKRLRDETDSAVLRVVEQIGEAAGGFSDKIGGAGQGVAAALLTTSNNLQNVVSQCQLIIKNTEATVQRFDGLVVGVSAATEDILTVHAAMKATAQPLQVVADRTATLISSVEQQVVMMGAAADSLQTTSKHMNDVQDTLSSSWSEYERRFKDVDTSLGNSLDQLKGGFDLYAEKIRDLNAGLDTHLGKALSDLSSVINELHESVEDLAAAMPVRATPGHGRP